MSTNRDLALTLWHYNKLNHKIKPADFIFVMCSYDLAVADCSYNLFQNRMGKFIVVSGGIAHKNDLLRTNWDEPEATVFKNRLLELGMLADKIIVEKNAKNCGENISFTKKILAKKTIKSGIIVQKPYMERRAYASTAKQWSEVTWQVTSPNVSYEDYIKKYDEKNIINIMVGDTWRIKDYAEKGFQTPQDMPEEVKKSLEELINRGYTEHING